MLNQEAYILAELKKKMVEHYKEQKYDRYGAEDILVMIAELEADAALGTADQEELPFNFPATEVDV